MCSTSSPNLNRPSSMGFFAFILNSSGPIQIHLNNVSIRCKSPGCKYALNSGIVYKMILLEVISTKVVVRPNSATSSCTTEHAQPTISITHSPQVSCARSPDMKYQKKAPPLSLVHRKTPFSGELT